MSGGSAASGAAERQRGAGFAWLLVAGLAVLTAALRGQAPINHDAAWIMQGALSILDGAEFGRDIVDVNPPLAWWLSLLPAALSRLAALDPGLSFVLFVAAWTVAALLVADRLLAAGGAAPCTRGIFLAGAAFVLLVAPAYDFGQREHVMVVAALPYLVSRSESGAGQRPRWPLAAAAGLLAAPGLCLKPHFLLVPALVELWTLARRRRLGTLFQPEPVLLALFGLGYAIAVWTLAPDYLGQVVPDAVHSYWAYRGEPRAVALAAAGALWLPAAVAAAAVLFARGSTLPRVLALAALASLAASLLQVKGWSYHLFPPLAFCGLSAVAAAAAWPAPRAWTGVAAAVLAVVAIFPAAARQALTPPDGGAAGELAAAFRQHAGAGGRVFAFITSPRNVHPAVLSSGVRWAASTCCLHLLPAAMRAPGDRLAVIAAERQLDRVLAELAADPPAVLAFDGGRWKLGFGGLEFDYLSYLGRRPGYARLFSLYREAPPVAAYRIFVREPSSAAMVSGRQHRRKPAMSQPAQQQTPPGVTKEMRPKPDHGEDSYKGSGKLAGKAAVITGGDSGIGRAVAIAYAREGADLLISYLDEHEDAQETARLVEDAGRRCVLMPGDIADPAHCRAIIRRAVDEFGRLDILVNNAAYQMTHETIEEIPDEEWDHTFAVNITAIFHLCKAAVPHMKEGASIINTSSVNSDKPRPTLLPYATTKGAIANFSAGLAQMLGERGIRVNSVAPGPIWTPLIPSTMPPEQVEKFGEDSPLGRAGQPRELAGIYVLLASDEGSYMSGGRYAVTGGTPIL